MNLSRFNKIFNFQQSLEEEQKKFVIRIKETIFNSIYSQNNESVDYLTLLENLCYDLGIHSNWLIEYNYDGEVGKNVLEYTKGDYIKTLQALVGMHEILLRKNHWVDQAKVTRWRKSIVTYIELALSKAEPILNLRWHDGMFLPANDELLDSKIVEAVYDKLIPYDNEHKDLRIALNYLVSGNLNGVVEKCYTALEGMTRKCLGNDKMLSTNEKELLSFLSLPDGFNAMFKGYLTYAQEYHRHAGEKRHELNQIEVETFVYVTCIMLRLILDKLEKKQAAQ